MPEHEKRKAQIARLLATVSVLGLSVGMFRPAAAADLTPSQQDKYAPTATGGASTPSDAASPKLYVTPGATDQNKLDSFSSGGPSDQLGSGGGAGKVMTTPGSADYMKYDTQEGTKQGKFDVPAVQNKFDVPAVQNKMNQPDAIYWKQTAPGTVQIPSGPPNSIK